MAVEDFRCQDGKRGLGIVVATVHNKHVLGKNLRNNLLLLTKKSGEMYLIISYQKHSFEVT